MEDYNPKSKSYIIREAENIVKSYIEKREFSDIKKYMLLKQKYERLKIISISMLLATCLLIILRIIG